jgi:DNA-binding protein HU-beta
MNKTDLINALSEETTFSKKDVSRVLDALTRVVERSLKKGDKVALAGFGTFSTSLRPARRGINPATKEKIDIPAIYVPKFKAGKNLRQVVRAL